MVALTSLGLFGCMDWTRPLITTPQGRYDTHVTVLQGRGTDAWADNDNC